MEQEQQYILNHLKDTFGGTFDEDIIESVLILRNWDVDRAVDDLMTMTIENEFEIPVEEIDVRDLHANAPVENLMNSETDQCSFVDDDGKMNNEDDGIVILDEEEYVVPTESDDSESNEGEQPQLPPQPAASSCSSLSYASIAQKPASENAVKAANNNSMSAKPPFIVYQGFTSYDRIKRARDSLERVKLYVQNRFKVMVILRGCPGSGKSTVAKMILKECDVKNNPFMHIHSADNFFCLNKEGRYIMDLDKLQEAHSWNNANLLSVIRRGLTPIVVDNTNTQLWEMQNFATMAVCAGYEMEVIEPDTPWAFNLNHLLSKNTHKVPREKLCLMLDRYDHNVSATTLLKYFKLMYAPSLTPPQKGVRSLSDPKLIAVFDRIYQTINIFPEKAPKHDEEKGNLTKKQKKKERKRLRKIIEEEAAAAAAFVELDELTETDSANSNHNDESDETVDEEENVVEKSDEDDSDKSWLTMDEEISDLSCYEEESDVLSTNSDTLNESFEKEGTNTVDDGPVEVLTPSFENTNDVDEKPLDLIPALIDTLGNPLNLNQSSTALDDDILENCRPRLKCFEKLRDDGKKEGNLDSCVILNNSSGIESEKADNVISPEPIDPVSNDVNLTNISTFESSKTVASSSSSMNFPDFMTGSFENLSAELSCSSKKMDGNSNLMNALENFALSVNKTPSPVEIAFSGEKITHNLIQNAEMSPDKNCLLPEKVVDNIYNADTKDKKFKLCNIGGEKIFPAELTSETACSLKFKDDREGNMIANDLWGVVDEQNDRSPVRLEEKELSDDNSDNSDSRSNSSSSDETAITDVHNTSNRFVNNDITNEQSERKKPDINREKKNQNLVDDTVDNVWTLNDSITPELNTLKERILINSLDKVFNQNQNIEPPAESTSTAMADKQVNLPQRRSTTSTPFYIIENRLKSEPAEVYSPSSSRSDDFEDAIDSWENRFVSQWMRGDTWADENRKDSQDENRKSEPDIKPQRKIRESPSKQKNTEMTVNRRVVNDIRNVSDNSKLSSMLDKNNKNQDSVPSQPFKSINFQRELWLDRSVSSSSSLNTIQRMPSKEEDIESGFEAKSKSFLFSDEHSFDSQRKNPFLSRSYQSPFRNFDANESQFWPGLSDGACSLWGEGAATEPSSQWSGGQLNNGSPELLDSLIALHKNINKDENSSEHKESVSKWNPFSDTSTKVKTGEASAAETRSCHNFFVPVDIMNQERNKATNTGWDDGASISVIKMGQCREINEGRQSPENSTIKASYKCDKSTMADASNYTLKAKPLKEDLVNIFPVEMVDVILDLYDKCNGNMDWIIEILMEDGYSPSDDQLEYLSSLQNVMDYQTTQVNVEKVEKNKKTAEKKRGKGRNSKNGRGNNLQSGEGRRKPEGGSSTNDFKDSNYCEETDMVVEEHVDLFLDWSTVSQLLAYFGNPTIYSIRDYQPTVKLPLTLARQLHAYLIGSIIDQAEENEDLINQLSEEDYTMSSYLQNPGEEEFSLKDVSDVENSLNDILKDPFDLAGKCESIEATSTQTVVRSKDSFASKLSLNLLLKAFPTLDPSFVRSTFKAQNFNYYDTKNVLNQFGKEVPIDTPQIRPLEEDLLEDEDDIQFFGNHSTNPADTRNEVLQQVTEFRRNASLNQHQWRKCHENLYTAMREKKFGVAAYYRDMMNVLKQKYEDCNAHAAAVLINSSCLQNSDMIDLHYFKVTEALKALDKFLDQHLNRLMCSGRSRMTVYVVTGRGTRSVNGISRIQPPVKNRLKNRQITFEIESHNTGLVKAILRKNSLMSTDL